LNGDPGNFEFRASFFRIFLYHYVTALLFLVLIHAVFRILELTKNPFTLPALSVGLIAGCLYAAWRIRDHFRIVITDRVVIGPTKPIEDRVTIPLDEIDRHRSLERTLLQTITGTQRIWSVDDRFIVVRGDAFSGRVRGEILTRAGLIG
jgi:hypothetical protein